MDACHRIVDGDEVGRVGGSIWRSRKRLFAIDAPLTIARDGVGSGLRDAVAIEQKLQALGDRLRRVGCAGNVGGGAGQDVTDDYGAGMFGGDFVCVLGQGGEGAETGNDERFVHSFLLLLNEADGAWNTVLADQEIGSDFGRACCSGRCHSQGTEFGWAHLDAHDDDGFEGHAAFGIGQWHEAGGAVDIFETRGRLGGPKFLEEGKGYEGEGRGGGECVDLDARTALLLLRVMGAKRVDEILFDVRAGFAGLGGGEAAEVVEEIEIRVHAEHRIRFCILAERMARARWRRERTVPMGQFKWLAVWV